VFDQYVRLKERKPKMHPPLKLKEGSVFPLLGVETPLIFTRTSQRTVQVTREKGAVVIAVPEGVAREDRDFLVRQAFKRWLREYLRERSELIMARYTPQIRRCPRMLKLKTMKSRWGSCGPDGIINLNDVLVFAPARALEYVLVHELCHLIHRDHSERFWGLVERLMPNFETQREWLKINGDGLHQLMQE
jgi:predicted metal-dependent hydrolase